MTSERRIEITLLPQRKRAPGGHWSSYRAVYCDDPHGLVGYGTTLREANANIFIEDQVVVEAQSMIAPTTCCAPLISIPGRCGRAGSSTT